VAQEAATAEAEADVVTLAEDASREPILGAPAIFVTDTLASIAVRSEVLGSETTVVAVRQPDAVLAPALVTDFKDITVTTTTQMLRDDLLLRKLEEMKRQMQVQGDERRTAVASTIALTSGLSIGYVVWLVRGGILVGSMMSALPAWQMIDPLPILAAAGSAKKAKGKGGAGYHDEPEVERLFDEAAPAADRTPAPASAPVAAPSGADAGSGPVATTQASTAAGAGGKSA